MAVPLPLSRPVMLVDSVNVGVAPPLDEPAKPLEDATDTEVTVPEPLLLNVFQSVELRYPLLAVPACVMPIVGVRPPVDVMGAVTPIELT